MGEAWGVQWQAPDQERHHGAEDEPGGTAVAGKLGTHDVHAVMFHVLGLHPMSFECREWPFTDVYGEAATDLLE